MSPEFAATLSNLLFSQNNPFQSNFNFVSDNAHLVREHAKIENDYGKQTSVSYVVQGKHLAYNQSMGNDIKPSFLDTNKLILQMEQKVAQFDIPAALENEQQLHESGNDFLQ